jgi:pimeloyl-ACP methyl ester carboxylesterase
MPTLTARGTTISYEQQGDGPPVILLHGFPLDNRIWQQQLTALSDRWRVITPDLRGFGKSASLDPFTMESLADDIHALLTELNALPCVLGGLSMGGYVALAYAKRYPADLRGLILIDTRAEADTAQGKQARQSMIDLVRKSGSPAVAEQMMPKMLAPDEAQRRPQLARDLRTIMEACPPLTIEHALAAMRDRADHTTDLASISVPTLIIVGEQDAITPPPMAQAMNQAIPHSTLHLIRGAGHMSPMEQPQQVTSALRRFLEQLPNS